MQPNALHKRNPVPVLKRPRREWRIPQIDACARLLRQQQEEARLKALAEGTTPEGRELFRKMLYEAEKGIDQNTDRLEIVNLLESRIKGDKPLQPEYALLLSRFYRQPDNKFQTTSPRLLAHLALEIVLCSMKRNNQVALGGHA